MDCFRAVRDWNYGIVMGSPGIVFRTNIGPCVQFCVYC